MTADSIYDMQSFEVEEGVRASMLTKDCSEEPPFHNGVTTEWECFMSGLTISRDSPMIGTKRPSEYEWSTYYQVYGRVCRFGSGMITVGVSPGQDEKIGIMMSNRAEWNVALLGGYLYSLVNVPLYTTFSRAAIRFIIEQTQLRTVIVEKGEQARLILSLFDEAPSSVNRLIVVDEVPPDVEDLAAEKNISIFRFSAVEKVGNGVAIDRLLPRPSDLAVIMYTSGTTGNPKGVMIEHKAVASTAAMAKMLVESTNCMSIGRSDVYFSYLPLSHSYERVLQTVLMISGSAFGYFSGDIQELTTEAQTFQPTIMAMVPRILNRIYTAILSNVKATGGIKETLFDFGLNESTPDFIRKVIFKDARKIFGGRLRSIFCASAPLDPQIKITLGTIFGMEITEAYGLTENYGAMACSLPGDKVRYGGYCPIPGAFIKLHDIPEMKYYVREGKGELCYKGAGLMKGYYREEEKTAEVIDDDGWFHTGDVCLFTERGTVQIIDRKKSIFKLSQGEYVAPEKIQNIYQELPFVGQMFVYGNSLESHLVGLVFPDQKAFTDMFGDNDGQTQSDFDRLCDSTETTKEVLRRLHLIGKTRDLKGFEQVKRIRILPCQLTLQDDMLTPTLKMKRNNIVERFKDDLKSLYHC